MNTLTIDCEFSNFSVQKGDLIQLALIADVNGERHTFNEYARPVNRQAWSADAEKVHGISWLRSQEFQTIEEMAKKLGKFLDQFDTVFVVIGWNCATDKKYLEKTIKQHLLQKEYYYKIKPDWIDVLKMVRKRKNQITLPNQQLSTVAKHFGIEFKAHDALEDAVVTYKLYELVNAINADDCNFIQISNNAKLTEVEKRHKYLDMKYVQISDGEVFLTKDATSDKEAMRVIFYELWSLFCE